MRKNKVCLLFRINLAAIFTLHLLIEVPLRPCRFPGNKTRNEAVKKNSQPVIPIVISCSNITLHGLLLTEMNVTKQALNFFSEETAVLSGKMRSLDLLLLFDQAKSRR